MKAVLLILVTIFLCALCVEADVAVQPDFDIEKVLIGGFWEKRGWSHFVETRFKPLGMVLV